MRNARTALTIALASVALFTAACGDSGMGDDDDDMTPDASTADAPETPDAMEGEADADTTPDAMVDLTGISTARAAGDGTVDIAISGVYVTYTKPAIGNDVAGFFVQAEPTGPALFIAVDPATLTPTPAVGDDVDFTITEMATAALLRQATAVTDVVVNSSGNDLSGLVQNISDATDVVSAVGSYESELVTATMTLTDDPQGAGSGHVAALVDTAGITGDTDLRFRIPDDVQTLLGLENGCGLTVNSTPMWRFNTAAQISAWDISEVSAATCPTATAVQNAVAISETEVLVTFNRGIDPASITDASTQFTFDNGLTASAAAVDGRDVTLTTDTQVGGTTYTLTVDASVTDYLGGAVDSATTAQFTGFLAPAIVRINEIAGAVSSSCDLVEIRVLQGGTLEGFSVTERSDTILTFPAFVVQTNDFIVVHWDDADCNPGGASNETSAVDEFPEATHANNFDTAYDWYSSDTGMTATDNVIAIEDAAGNIVDAVFAADAPTGTAAAATETRAAEVAAVGEWEMVGGGIPAGGFVDDAFCGHAVLDLNASNRTDSIQRLDDGDDNDKDDWTSTNTTATFGDVNDGQSSL